MTDGRRLAGVAEGEGVALVVRVSVAGLLIENEAAEGRVLLHVDADAVEAAGGIVGSRESGAEAEIHRAVIGPAGEDHFC